MRIKWGEYFFRGACRSLSPPDADLPPGANTGSGGVDPDDASIYYPAQLRWVVDLRNFPGIGRTRVRGSRANEQRSVFRGVCRFVPGTAMPEAVAPLQKHPIVVFTLP